MKTKLINETIAEFYGWKRLPDRLYQWESPSGTLWTDCPPYSKQIHSVQKACKKLNPNQRREFIINLCNICDRDFGNSEVDPSDVFDPNEMAQMFLIDCSSEQLAEALYLTIKK